MRALDQSEQEQRKRKILQYVISEYIRTGKPVGSQALAASSRIDLSSATIRNVLMDLEKEGMITHPHTSAGRIPTDKGYRFYVDAIVEMQRLAAQEKVRIQQEYEKRMNEIEGLMSQTSRMLSSVSKCAGFVMTPKFDKNIFTFMELVPVGGSKILVVMVTESGMSKNFTIKVQKQISRENLRNIAQRINQSCQGYSLQEVKNILVEKIKTIEESYRDMLSVVKEIGEEISKFSVNEIYWEGTSNILALPDLSQSDDIYSLFRRMEEKETIAHLLEEQAHQMESEIFNEKQGRKNGGKNKLVTRVRVQIGSENPLKELQNLSVVTSTYKINDRTVGLLGIMGPKRMQYDKMISLVDYVSQVVNQMLREFEEK